MTKRLIILFLVAQLISLPALALKPIKLSKIPSAFDGATLLAVGRDGTTVSTEISGRSATITPESASSRLYVRSGGTIEAAIVGPTCRRGRCNTKTVVSLAAKPGAKIKLAAYKNDGLLSAKGLDSTSLRRTFVRNVTAQKSTVVSAIASKGLSEVSQQSLVAGRRIGVLVEESDGDNDGLVDQIDSDDDGDETLDNYDSDSGGGTADSSSFPVFSNFKLAMESSLNLHATGLSATTRDALLSTVQTLAIGVAGPTTATAELDCGSLGYCSAGGTGITVEGSNPFPGTAGGSLDSDSDGLGTIARGSTGDFQLKTGATAATIGAGDTMIQRITASDASESEASGMLNFVFHSSPALKTLAVNSGSAETIDYTATPIKGSSQNCFSAPASGDVTISITGWRPQRPGVSEAGEGEYVDIGNSTITADIPNAPCTLSGGGGCSGTGPGNCAAAAYSTTDSNLTVGTNGIADGRGDVDADTTNTYSFTVNLSSCLSSAPSGSIAWNAGETLFVDMQFKSNFGDNAAQKFCITRAAS